MTVSCRIFGLLSVVSLAVFVLAGCARAKNTNCRELFEKYYEVNVAAFMRTMPAADSAAVRKKAEYALDKMYRIDSPFVLMRGKELDDFIRVNLPAIVGADAED